MPTGNALLHRVADRLDGPPRDELLRLGMPSGDPAALEAWTLERHKLTKSLRSRASRRGRPPISIPALAVIAAAHAEELSRGLSIRAANATVTARLGISASAGSTAYTRLVEAVQRDFPAASFESSEARAQAYIAEAVPLLADEQRHAEAQQQAEAARRRDARHVRKTPAISA